MEIHVYTIVNGKVSLDLRNTSANLSKVIALRVLRDAVLTYMDAVHDKLTREDRANLNREFIVAFNRVAVKLETHAVSFAYRGVRFHIERID